MTDARSVAIHPLGKDAASPWRMPWAAWRQVAMRTWQEATDDNVGLIAAGVAFYGFLAIVPLLGATVLIYGLIADHETVARNVRELAAIMPREAAQLIGDQLNDVVAASDGKKGLGLLAAIALALFGARGGAGAVIMALNIAYEEQEKRGFLKLNLVTLTVTTGAVAIAVIAVCAIAALGHLDTIFPYAPGFALLFGQMLSYVLLVLAAAAGAATLYRYGPSRDLARWTWLSPGSALFAVAWLVLTLGFGIYVANFGSYDATYGSLGAVVVLLTWLYLSSYILMFGAELNSELEHQTAKDTTRGAERPLGQRGAWVADHVADAQPSGNPMVQAQSMHASPWREDGDEPEHMSLGFDRPTQQGTGPASRSASLMRPTPGNRRLSMADAPTPTSNSKTGLTDAIRESFAGDAPLTQKVQNLVRARPWASAALAGVAAIAVLNTLRGVRRS